MIRKLAVITGALALVTLMSANAFALTINDPGVVGAYGVDSAAIDQLLVAQHLLDMGGGATDPGSCSLTTSCYQTSTTDYYDTLTQVASGGGADGGITLPAGGYDYILVKYDGASAGYVLFYTDGLTGAFAVPSPSFPLWTDNTSQYTANNWTAFNCTTTTCRGIPDGGSTSALLGSALFAIGVLARKFRKV